MLEDQGFCGHDAPAARTQKPRQGDEQMDPQNHKIAHASNRTTLEIQQWGIAQRCAPELNFTNSHPTGERRASGEICGSAMLPVRSAALIVGTLLTSDGVVPGCKFDIEGSGGNYTVTGLCPNPVGGKGAILSK